MERLSKVDFKDFIQTFNNADVEYILVGGYAVILHGYNRTTGNMDWVNQSEENYLKIGKAFKEFGMPLFDMTKENFLNNEKMDVFSFGVSPVKIDLMVKVKGLQFDQAHINAQDIKVEGLSIKLISLSDLIKAKRAANRYKDLNDIEHLTK